ncbi:MAG TPA: DUF6789 family protein [Bacillota bacterium]|nr:DUF6789 family protein [Bacillota bacterium]
MRAFLKDRVIQGLIAGIAGSIPQLAFSLTVYWLFHFQKLQFYQFAGILAFNHRPIGLGEILFSESIVLGQMAVYGILFTQLLAIIARSNLLLKGAMFGGFCWYTTYVLATLYKTKGIHGVMDFPTAVTNLIASAIWGVAMAWIFQFLHRRYGIENKI